MVRVIQQLVDEGVFDVDAVLTSYSGRGSAPHPPGLLLKLTLYEHCRGRTKPTQWYEDLQSDMKVQWLVFGMKVSQRALYRFRDRVGPLLEAWNKQVLQQAVNEQLVKGRQASIDGTTVAANASRRKLANMQQVEDRLAKLEHAMSSTAKASAQALPAPGWMAKTATGKWEQHARYTKAKAKLVQMHAKNEKRRSDKRKPLEKIVISLTDPESVFGLDKQKVYRPLYNVQTVSDLATDFALAYGVFAQHSDSGALQPMLNEVREIGIHVEDLLADAGYAVGEDLKYCESVAITLYAPWQENSSTSKKKKQLTELEPPIEKDNFQWDDARKVYVCPEGKELSFAKTNTRQRANGDSIKFKIYQASPSDCTACPLQPRCTKVPKKGRTVRRDPHQEAIDRLQARMQTKEAKLLYKKRGQTIERVFADFKEHRNLRRFRGRGLSRARTQMGLTVLGHNLRLLAKHRKIKSQEAEGMPTLKNAA